MLNKETCRTLLPLVNNQPAWESLTSYLQDLQDKDRQALIQETQEVEVRHQQGRLQLIQHLLSLKDEVNTQQKEYLKSGSK
jgi:hypothetical protein